MMNEEFFIDLEKVAYAQIQVGSNGPELDKIVLMYFGPKPDTSPKPGYYPVSRMVDGRYYIPVPAHQRARSWDWFKLWLSNAVEPFTGDDIVFDTQLWIPNTERNIAINPRFSEVAMLCPADKVMFDRPGQHVGRYLDTVFSYMGTGRPVEDPGRVFREHGHLFSKYVIASHPKTGERLDLHDIFETVMGNRSTLYGTGVTDEAKTAFVFYMNDLYRQEVASKSA